MTPSDLAFVVHEHRTHFPDGFFVRLGSRFLTEYYRTFLTGPRAHAYLAELDGQRVGYLVGVDEPAAHRQHVLHRHGFALIRKGLAALLVRPALAWFFIRTRARLYLGKLLRRTRTASAAGASAGSGSTAVLTHVAVTSTAQSRGVGSALINRFESDVSGAGCRRVLLVTAAGESGAGPYYERAGWTPRGEHRTRDQALLTTYERSLVSPRHSGPGARDTGAS